MDEILPHRTVQIVHNPLAGSFNRVRLAALASAFERAGYGVSLSESSARSPFSLQDGVDHLCVVGGDGTVRQVVAALVPLGPLPRLSIYPMGTINLVAREWDVPSDPDIFVQSFADQSSLRPVRINDTFFIACASIGPDARAVAAVSEPLKRRIGRLAYGVSIAREFMRWSRPKLKFTVNGEQIDCEALYIAKGRYFAGPWSFAPEARVDQPELHIVALKTARRRDFLRFMIATMTGSTRAHSNIIRLSCRSLSLDGAGPVQADGDIITHLPAELQIV